MNVVVFGAIYRSSEYNRQSMEENRQRRIYGISGRVPVIGRRTENFLIPRLSFVFLFLFPNNTFAGLVQLVDGRFGG